MNSGNQLKSLKLYSSHAAVKLAKFTSTLTVNHSRPFQSGKNELRASSIIGGIYGSRDLSDRQL